VVRVEIVYFTVAGIVLYLFSDWLLDRIESARGQRFEHRSVVFFIIILSLAVLTFQLLSRLKL
jgi:hypothetical protein